MRPICGIAISMICTGTASSFNTVYCKTNSLPCEDGKATILALTLSSHNLPTNCFRELFEPTKEEKHLLGSVFEKSGTFVFKHFSVRRHDWGGLEIFG